MVDLVSTQDQPLERTSKHSPKGRGMSSTKQSSTKERYISSAIALDQLTRTDLQGNGSSVGIIVIAVAPTSVASSIITVIVAPAILPFLVVAAFQNAAMIASLLRLSLPSVSPSAMSMVLIKVAKEVSPLPKPITTPINSYFPQELAKFLEVQNLPL